MKPTDASLSIGDGCGTEQIKLTFVAGDQVQQIKGMLRDTWWLWLIFVFMATFLVFYLSVFFAFIYPMLIVVCVYFALVRYDENGQERRDF